MVRFDYMLGDVSIDGVSIKEYTVVYPEGADLVTYYLAHNISDYFLTNAGYALNVTSDKATAQKYEILVGSTNRSEDDAAVAMALGDDQYVLCKNGDKIVMWGKSYMVGGAASALVNTFVQSAGVNTDVNVTSLPASPAAATFSFKKATSAILMIGDGMGFNHILSAGAIGMTEFVADRLPSTSCTTHSQSVINNQAEFTDSAAAATALATGYKTINGFIGVDAAGVNRQNVRELAHATGARTAVITTDVITGATPAGFLCHSGSRNDTSILQSQIDDLIKTGGVNYAVGGFKEKELTDYAREALSVISENGSDYFIMIEEAHIDKHSHKNTLSDVQLAVTYYNDAIAYVIGFVMMHPDTALIVTADHECGKMYIDQDTGAFRFDSDDHSNTQVPFYAIGGGTAELLASAPVLDNTMVAKFIAEIFGANSFGQ